VLEPSRGNQAPYGAFIDTRWSNAALLHISEISHEHIETNSQRC